MLRTIAPLTVSALALTIAACGDGGAGSAGGAASEPALRIVGSSTVYPFTTAVVEDFTNSNPGVPAPIVESTGTGGGMKLFCAGVGLEHPDLANASRRIKASELQMCNENGVNQVIELQVGIDGIAFAQNRDASDLALSAEQLYRALAATAPDGTPNTVTNWNEIDPSLPDRRIEVLGPPPTSGTRDAFNELVMQAGCEEIPELAALEDEDEGLFEERCTRLREDGAYVESGENDNLIVQKLVSNPVALGIFGYSYLDENLDQVEPVPLNGVLPSYDNIADGSYIAARSLYIYAKGEHLAAKPALGDFLAAYASEAVSGPDGLLASQGLIAAPDEARAENRDAASGSAVLTASDLDA
ncbi:MAG: substrate-binding domain-containing protein [Pacificimonas sp.]